MFINSSFNFHFSLEVLSDVTNKCKSFYTAHTAKFARVLVTAFLKSLFLKEVPNN